MCIVMTMNIYITPDNEKALKELKARGSSMSGLVNHLLNEWREAGKPVLLSTNEVSSNIRPDIKKISDLPDGKIKQLADGSTAIVIESTPPGPNEFKEALDAAEQKCCRLKSPCKHWQFDGEDWVNTLSGRKREVEQ